MIKSFNHSFFNAVPYSNQSEFSQKVKRALEKHKLVHLTNVPPHINLFDYYKTMNQSLGQLIRRGEDLDHQNGFTNDQWLDVRYDKAYAHTFRHSNTRQPFHTDGAYITDFEFNIVFLFCTEPSTNGGATIFLDAEALILLLKANNVNLLEQLMQEEVVFGKGKFGVKKSKIIDQDDTGYLLNWNYYRVADENSTTVKEMVQSFHNFLESEVFKKGQYHSVHLKKGECVYFYDRRVLHGRTAFQGNRCLIKGALNF